MYMGGLTLWHQVECGKCGNIIPLENPKDYWYCWVCHWKEHTRDKWQTE